MTSAIKPLLVSAIYNAVKVATMDAVPAGDETRVGTVVRGRYLGDIPTLRMAVEIHSDHLLGPDERERRNTQADYQRDGYRWVMPPETIGGSFFRWIRGTILVNYHFEGKTRQEGLDLVEVVISRIRYALNRESSLVGISDDFGSMIHAFEVADIFTYTNEAGNPAVGRTFIDWRALESSTRSR
jgi:hypothetical protein